MEPPQAIVRYGQSLAFRSDPSLLEGLAERFIEPNIVAFGERMTAAQEQGQLPLDADISTLRDLPTLMETVYQLMVKTLPVDLFFIGLYDAAKNEMTFPVMYDEGRRWEQPPTQVTDTTFTGKTILTLKDFGLNYDLGPASATAEVLLDIEGVKK